MYKRQLYNLPSVIDDVEMEISNIIRGEDHVTNSGIQIEMFSSLGKNAPIFGHHPLLVDENGDPFSKRNAASSIKSLKLKNFEPMAINSLNISIGTSIEINSFRSLKEISDILDLSKLGRAPGRFSLDQLIKLNSSQLSILSFKEIKDRLKTENIIAYEPLWEIVKNNINFLSEYSEWDKIINKDIEIKSFDNKFLKLAADALPNQPWDEKTWNLWIEKIKDSTDRRGKDCLLYTSPSPRD